MRVLFLIRSLVTGGTERQLVVLAIGLKRLGYSVKVAVFYSGGSLEAELKSAEIPIVDLHRKGRWEVPFFFFRLLGLLRREHPDVVYSYLQVANIWSILIKPLVPSTPMIWGIRSSNVDLSHYDWQTQFTYRLETWLARFPDQIICNSFAGMKDARRRGVPQSKMCVIPNGIDVERFHPSRAVANRLRKEWRVKRGEKLIGVVGRLDPMKDHVTFFRAAALLIQERNRVRFVCVGGGPKLYETTLHELATKLNIDNVLIWAGEQQDMQSVYNGLDLLVLSSSTEGFPNVVGEAMACGVPCVVTDVGDSARIVGDVGEIVPPRDPLALKDGMIKMLGRIEKERSALSQRSRQRIIDEFSVQAMLDRTIEVLERLA